MFPRPPMAIPPCNGLCMRGGTSAFAPARLARRATRSPFLSASAAVRSPARVFAMAGFHDLSAKDIDGADVAFDRFKDKVVLVTNVASA
eukprot:jgi/Tetstr1/432130/TSEL_021587.t1